MSEIDTLAPLHHAQAIFAAFDAKDLAGLAALVTGLDADYPVYMDINRSMRRPAISPADYRFKDASRGPRQQHQRHDPR